MLDIALAVASLKHSLLINSYLHPHVGYALQVRSEAMSKRFLVSVGRYTAVTVAVAVALL